MIQNENNSMVL